MFVKRLTTVLIALAAALTPVYAGYAAGELLQAGAWERYIDVYVPQSLDPESVVCKVSNQTAQIVGSGPLAESGVTVRTTVLVDISTSIPSKLRGSVIAYVNSAIENIGATEQLKIVAFGDQLNILHDFTSDRYDLANAANGIEFNGQQSKIYDAIYNTLPSVEPIDTTPCYYRTVVITDGVDDTASGVTKEELYLKLQSETYPIDVVAVSAADQAEQNKDLAALTRISGGRYGALGPGTDAAVLTASLSTDGVYWLRVAVPDALLDGSTRQVNITDGDVSVQFDVKTPVYDVPAEPSPEAETPENTPESPPEREPERETNEIEDVEDEGDEEESEDDKSTEAGSFFERIFGSIPLRVYIGAGAAVVIIAAAVTVILIIRKSGKRDNIPSAPRKTREEAGQSPGDETEFVFSAESSDAGGINTYARLCNPSNAEQVWNANLTAGAVIGREASCQIRIADNSVSRRQCRLYMSASAAAENLSSSNVTKLNGKPLSSPMPIKAGDELKFGRVTIVVDSLYEADSRDAGGLDKGTVFINK
jgi:hypothetical protein